MKMIERVNQLQKYSDEFHDHLDQCNQCRNHPFGLCYSGSRLLNLAAGHDPKNWPEKSEAPKAVR